MALTVIEMENIKLVMNKFISKRRPPEDIRDKVDLAFKIEGQNIEIYEIRPQFEGKGIISQAVSETIDFCFTKLEMNKVYICTSKINKGSQQIALKHGFQKEGILRKEFKNHESILEDIVYFGLLKTDYYNER